MYPTNQGKPVDALIAGAVHEIAELVRRNDEAGIFRSTNRAAHAEAMVTSVIPALLTPLTTIDPPGNPRKLLWTGQQPSITALRGYVDTGLVCDDTIKDVRGIFPMGFIRFALSSNTTRDKAAQQFLYALHLMRMLPRGVVCCVLGCLVAFDDSGPTKVTVTGYCPQSDARLFIASQAATAVPIAEVLLFDSSLCGLSPYTALQRALKALLNNATHLGYHTSPLPPNSQHIKAVRNGDKVYKEYGDFDDFDNVACKRPGYNLQFLPNCTKFAELPGSIVVLEYDYIRGTHEMTAMGQCEPLVRALHALHAEHKLCHGDVRARNIIFEPGNTARFIDYDHCAPVGWVYTPRYNTAIDDGARHPGARPGHTLEPLHDWFALAAVLRLFAPMDPAHNDRWAHIVGAVETGDHATALPLIAQGCDVRMARAAAAVAILLQSFDGALMERSPPCHERDSRKRPWDAADERSTW